MVGRLFNKMRKEREREEEWERRRPQHEAALARHKAHLAWIALMATDEPWQNTRRIRCACGNTTRFSIPEYRVTLRCTKCGGRQTVIG